MKKKIEDGAASSSTFRGSALRRLKMNLRSLEKSTPNASNHNRILTKKARQLTARKESNKAFKEFADDLKSKNPFDLQTSRMHFNVLNRMAKGQIGRPGISRRRNLEKRYKMLGQEIEKKGKRGEIIDRRIGEFDPSIPHEEKVRARLMEDNVRLAKRGIFDLEDRGLTHLGQSLSIDDYNNDAIDDMDSDDSDPGDLGYDAVSSSNFGGFKPKFKDTGYEEQQTPKKSRTEIMQEIISKSKDHKRERRLINEENVGLANEVDKSIDKIKNLVPMRRTLPRSAPDGDQYDSLLIDLRGDDRSTPATPLMTEEQGAALNAKMLETLEKSRSMKIANNDEHSTQNPDSYVGFSHSAIEEKKLATPQPLLYKDGILISDFSQEEASDSDSERRECSASSNSDDDRDSGSEEETDDNTDSEQGTCSAENDEDVLGNPYSELEDGTQNSSDACEEGTQVGDTQEKDEKANIQACKLGADSELPYTFKIPESFVATLELFEGRTIAQCETIIQRISVIYSVDANSRKLLERFIGFLLDYLYYILNEQKCEVYDSLPIFFQLVELGRKLKAVLAKIIKNKYKSLLNSLSVSPSEVPSTADCLLLSLVSNVYGSGLEVPLFMQGLLVMCKFISQKAEFSYERVFKRLWVMDVIADFALSSKLYIPELLHSVDDIINLCTTTDVTCGSGSKLELNISWTQDVQKFDALFAQINENMPKLKEFLSPTLTDVENAPILIFLLSLKLLARIAHIYRSVSGFELALAPLVESLRAIDPEKLNPKYKVYLITCIQELQSIISLLSRNRTPLRFHSKFKDAPIRMETPKFFDEYSTDPRKRGTKTAIEKQRSKLLHLHKKEKRGAMRDLRRDASVINDIRAKKKEEERLKYNKMIKSVVGQLSQQEGEERVLERRRKRKTL